MIHSAEAMNGERAGLPVRDSRKAAFREASRHSARVRFLRRAILVGSLGGILVVVIIGLFDPFSRLPKNITVGHTGLDGTRITMESPRLSGYHQDGHPYEVRAAAGVQDIRNPNIIELHEVDARFTLTDNSIAHLESPAGVFDNGRNLMTFPGRVQITTTSGYDIHMQSAEMDVKAGTMTSNDTVTVRMNNGTIAADRLSMTNADGPKIIFDGNVRSTFEPNDGTSATSGTAKESAP
jgi:lipopolysaccharide export system protein LptC